MADAAVRVDIIVGQNTVVPSVERTKSALTGVANVATRTNAGFESLSKQGLRRLEGGFQSLAFSAAGVPGPLGKIASGALMLGGGQGLLFGAAVAAGALAAAWGLLTKVSDEAKSGIDRMTAALNKNKQAMLDQLAVDKEWTEREERYGFLRFMVSSPGLLGQFARGLLEVGDNMRIVADQFSRMQAHGAADDFLSGLWKGFDARDTADAKRRKAAKAARDKALGALAGREGKFGVKGPSQDTLESEFLANARAAMTFADAQRELNATLAKMPKAAENGTAALDILREQTADAVRLTEELVAGINDALLTGFMDLAAGLAQALAGDGNFGQVIVAALGKMMQDIGHLLISFGVQLTILKPLLSNLLTSGPAMIAAGILISAAGAAVSKRAQGGQVSASAGRGGVNSGQYERDQQDMGARGTVTVTMKDGFIRPSDPAFQEFLAQVIKEAKGRNVVFA